MLDRDGNTSNRLNHDLPWSVTSWLHDAPWSFFEA
jgi:hypothetical protein